VNGARGEAGGQLLRSALSLSLLIGQPFGLTRIRAKRDRPGLRPQRLAAVQAAAKVCAASVTGDRIGSETIAFAPGPVRVGDYFFDIGPAGSTSLVLQTLLLPLALAGGAPSSHCAAAPTYLRVLAVTISTGTGARSSPGSASISVWP
jgi:RNA 3'-terminal phosphate cyclase (ATP)